MTPAPGAASDAIESDSMVTTSTAAEGAQVASHVHRMFRRGNEGRGFWRMTRERFCQGGFRTLDLLSGRAKGLRPPCDLGARCGRLAD